MLYYFFLEFWFFSQEEKTMGYFQAHSSFLQFSPNSTHRLRPPKIKFQEEIFHKTQKILELDEI